MTKSDSAALAKGSPPMPPGPLAALTCATALSMGSLGALVASTGRIPLSLGLGAGAVVAFLMVIGLPSVGPRRAALAAQTIGIVVLVRALAVPGSDPVWLLPWSIGLVSTLVLAAAWGSDARPLAADAPRDGGRKAAKAGLGVSLLVIAVVLLVGPVAASVAGDIRPRSGDDTSDRATPPTLLAADTLDMTTRPELTDTILMTVRASEPSFWRGQVFDQWDGRTWSRSEDTAEILIADAEGTRRLVPSAEDLGAQNGDEITQTFNLVAPASTLLFAAPSPVRVNARAAVLQRPDGTALTSPLGAGASYTVVSRRIPVTRSMLQEASGPVPPEVTSRYASPPVASERTVAAAESVTAGASTTYEKVMALQAWMGRTTEYSLDAPTARRDSDVVDDFLFVQRQGWCEQIASSLVVLLRSVGVPARLATGFVPGDSNPLTDVYTVRARQAHAWTEVWFPGIGWHGFDPTAQVPLAGEVGATTAFEQLTDNAVPLALAASALVGVALLLRLLMRVKRARTKAPALDWSSIALARLEEIGQSAERPRAMNETGSRYGAAVAERVGEPALAEVGRLIDDDRYRPDPLPAEDRATVDAALVAVLERR